MLKFLRRCLGKIVLTKSKTAGLDSRVSKNDNAPLSLRKRIGPRHGRSRELIKLKRLQKWGYRFGGRWLAIALATSVLLVTHLASLPIAQAIQSPAANQPAMPEQQAYQWLQQGIQHLQANELNAAQTAFQEALRLYQQAQNVQGELWSLERLARVQYALGNYEQARQLYEQHLARSQQTGRALDAANAWANLGNLHQAIGNYAAAIDAFQTSLKLRRTLPQQPGEGLVLGNLGNLYTILGRYERATELQERSLEIAKISQNEPVIANTLNSLGALHSLTGRYPQAIQTYEAALQQAKGLGNRSLAAKALNNLGSVYHAQKQFQPALTYYQQSLEIAQAIGNRKLESANLSKLGLAHSSLQQHKIAIQLQTRSVALARELRDRELESLALGNLGYSHWQAGDLEAAEQLLRQSLTVSESLRAGLTDSFKVSAIDTQLTPYYLLQQVLVERNQPEAALEIAERARARAFAELFSQRFTSPSSHAKNKALTESLQSPNLEQIRQIARDRNATLVAYSVIPEADFIAQGKQKGEAAALFIWVVQPNGTMHFHSVDLQQLRTEMGGQRLKDLVLRSRNSLGLRSRGLGVVATEDGASAREISLQEMRLQQLHAALIEPIADFLPTDPEAHVIFLPHDLLFLVPFAALQKSNGTYLLAQHTISLSPSIHLFDLTHQRRAQLGQKTWQQNPQAALVVGNPTMPAIPMEEENADAEVLPSLPGAEEEAHAIAKMLGIQALIGDAATETAIKQRLSQANLIHLATHGLLDNFHNGDIPGAIALAASANEDGLLTANEIMDLSINAELVVLSACDTGRGDITSDGVLGLSRALIAAGAPSAIVSLWAVPDAPTASLMTEFYAQLQKQDDKAQALRQAMLVTLERYPDPRDWAAFLLIGASE